MLRATAFQVSESIDVKLFKSEFADSLYAFDADELFYANEKNEYLYVFRFGVVAFLGYDNLKMSETLNFIQSYCIKPLNERMQDEFIIHENANKTEFNYNSISISQQSTDIYRTILFNLSQSVAIDFYSQQAELLLEDTKNFTLQLEEQGKLNISTKNLRKYIGKTLNLKNAIAKSLYVIDSHPTTWEDEYLNTIEINLKKTFDVRDRYRSINENLVIVKENLDLFKDMMQHRDSSVLEWIIIILILVEVMNLAFEKLF